MSDTPEQQAGATVTGVVPSSGSAARRRTLRIIGFGFVTYGITWVKVGGVRAWYRVVDDTIIEAITAHRRDRGGYDRGADRCRLVQPRGVHVRRRVRSRSLIVVAGV